MTIVVRRDLNMVPGLLAAQVFHAGMEFIRKRYAETNQTEPGILTKEEADWVQAPYVSVLAVDTPEELAVVEREAMDSGLQVHAWTDLVPSKVLGRSITCKVAVAIGPCDSDSVKLVTGTLPLF